MTLNTRKVRLPGSLGIGREWRAIVRAKPDVLGLRVDSSLRLVYVESQKALVGTHRVALCNDPDPRQPRFPLEADYTIDLGVPSDSDGEGPAHQSHVSSSGVQWATFKPSAPEGWTSAGWLDRTTLGPVELIPRFDQGDPFTPAEFVLWVRVPVNTATSRIVIPMYATRSGELTSQPEDPARALIQHYEKLTPKALVPPK